MLSELDQNVQLSELIKKVSLECIVSPEEINNGWCAAFAEKITNQFQDAEAMWLHDINENYYKHPHKVIVYKNKFYDAECPQGVQSIEEIPFVQRNYSSVDFVPIEY